MKYFKATAKPSSLTLLMLIALAGSFSLNAFAHGEKSQPAFMRMRTIQWLDLHWSKELLPVNDVMTVSGKFHVFSRWPETLGKPEVSFLNIAIPGPVFIRTGSWLGGQFAPRSVSLDLGKTYDFKVLLKARRPGDWHVHPMMNVQGAGPIVGPGKWVMITGKMSDFTNPITTLAGQTVDLENWNLGNIVFWHAYWYLFGIAYIAYWLRKPVFIPRLIAIEEGKVDTLITPTDKKIGIAFGMAAIVIVAISVVETNQQYPITIPLQTGLMRGLKPLDELPKTIKVKVDSATFRVPGRAMQMTLTITNNGSLPIRLGEFMTASVRFLDPHVYQDWSGYPDDLLTEEGLLVSDNSPLDSGQTRTVEVTVADAAWEVYRLADVIYDPDSRFAGLLFFFNENSQREMVEVDAPLIPSFI